MRNLSKQLHHDQYNQEPDAGRVSKHNSGQMSADASDQTGTTPFANLKNDGSSDSSKEDIRNRKVDPEAVRESFQKAELDPIAEIEPEEGEKAA